MTLKYKTNKTLKEIFKSFDYVIHINTFLIIIGAIFVVFKFEYQFEEIRTMMFSTILGSVFFYFTSFMLAFKIFFLIFILVHYLRYKPIKSVSDDELPKCTIIVPAYNEGKLVYDTLRSIHKSDYPKNKIQLMAIDDGSKYDT